MLRTIILKKICFESGSAIFKLYYSSISSYSLFSLTFPLSSDTALQISTTCCITATDTRLKSRTLHSLSKCGHCAVSADNSICIIFAYYTVNDIFWDSNFIHKDRSGSRSGSKNYSQKSCLVIVISLFNIYAWLLTSCYYSPIRLVECRASTVSGYDALADAVAISARRRWTGQLDQREHRACEGILRHYLCLGDTYIMSRRNNS